MRIREKISKFLMKKAIKSKIENLNTPGFITFGIGLGGSGRELREVFLPEKIYSEIEKRFEEEFGDEGNSILYKAGRRYGWRYTDIAEFPKNKRDSDKEIKKFLRFFSVYASTAYASDLTYELDMDNQVYELFGDRYSVCRLNGKGILIGMGAISGAVGRVFSNPDIHAVHPECMGRGNEQCHTICAEPDKLPEEPVSRFSDFDPRPLSRKYERLNKAAELEHVKKSMNDLLNEGFFQYRENLVYHKDLRHMPIEISMPYFIEKEAETKEGAPLILFDVSYRVGKELGEGEDLSYAQEYLGGLGWGDINVMENGDRVEISHFPWTAYSEYNDLNIFRGFISGIVSGVRGEDIRYNNYETEVSSDSFSLILKSGN